MPEYKVPLKAEHFSNADYMHIDSCPVANAINEAWGGGWTFGCYTASYHFQPPDVTKRTVSDITGGAYEEYSPALYEEDRAKAQEFGYSNQIIRTITFID